MHPERPFFAFLNYIDAHYPYRIPVTAARRFAAANDPSANELIDQWRTLDKQSLTPGQVSSVSDRYDDCIAYLDEQVGCLIDELQNRGILDRTIVVITSDHGEAFGEHGVFLHAASLYQEEIHVPLLVLLPSPWRGKQVVTDMVSLRDLPATIVDLLDLRYESPFPGESLRGYWAHSLKTSDRPSPGPVISILDFLRPDDPNQGRSPASHGPLRALAEGGLVYIHNSGDGREELYDERQDPGEFHDLTRNEEARELVSQMRQAMGKFAVTPAR